MWHSSFESIFSKLHKNFHFFSESWNTIRKYIYSKHWTPVVTLVTVSRWPFILYQCFNQCWKELLHRENSFELFMSYKFRFLNSIPYCFVECLVLILLTLWHQITRQILPWGDHPPSIGLKVGGYLDMLYYLWWVLVPFAISHWFVHQLFCLQCNAHESYFSLKNKHGTMPHKCFSSSQQCSPHYFDNPSLSNLSITALIKPESLKALAFPSP